MQVLPIAKHNLTYQSRISFPAILSLCPPSSSARSPAQQQPEVLRAAKPRPGLRLAQVLCVRALRSWQPAIAHHSSILSLGMTSNGVIVPSCDYPSSLSTAVANTFPTPSSQLPRSAPSASIIPSSAAGAESYPTSLQPSDSVDDHKESAERRSSTAPEQQGSAAGGSVLHGGGGHSIVGENGLPFSHSPALKFEVLAEQGRARASRMTLPHNVCYTPMFMPVGTQGSVKGMTAEQLKECGCQLILGNTYHLESRPGSDLVADMGGLHEFIGWPRAMLTDSGGFQMVSLLHLAVITEEGVAFQSPHDGRDMLLTPEHSITIQNRLGADIMMQLDDVVGTTVCDEVCSKSTTPLIVIRHLQSQARFLEATHRTTRWLDRCIAAHTRPTEQNLFAIIQGGIDPVLRDISLEGLIARQTPGYAVGGLSGGEDKSTFLRVVSQCTARLPAGKPRYVMGIGYPMDIVMCSALGADMFDSVYPTRTGRFGVALVPSGTLKLRNTIYAEDLRPLDEECKCMVCKRYTRAYLHSVVRRGLPFAAIAMTYHNVAYMQRLGVEIRAAITDQRFPEYVRGFVRRHHPDGVVPDWVQVGMELAGIEMDA